MVNLLSALTQLFYFGSLLLLLLCAGFIFFFIVFHKNQTRLLLEKKDMQFEFTRQLLHSQLEIQEQTFKTIAQEIHDNVGQILTLAKLNMSNLAATAPAPLAGQIENNKMLVARAIQDLRSLARGLNVDYITETGLIKAIEYQLEQIKKDSTLQINFTVSGPPCRFPPQTELIVYRMQQEIINNVIKHAAAQHIDISYNYSPGHFESTITDDGIGFAPGSLNQPVKGLGMGNLQSRAQVLGGRLVITSSPGKGTSVYFVLPV